MRIQLPGGVPGEEAGSSCAGATCPGKELAVAKVIVMRAERKRLEERAKARAAPMEEEAASVDGRPTGEDGQPRGEHASPKRARASPPETGCARGD